MFYAFFAAIVFRLAPGMYQHLAVSPRDVKVFGMLPNHPEENVQRS